jgi:hypothetical protein
MAAVLPRLGRSLACQGAARRRSVLDGPQVRVPVLGSWRAVLGARGWGLVKSFLLWGKADLNPEPVFRMSRGV